MQSMIQNLLKQFYSQTVQNHYEKDLKKQSFEQAFSKLHDINLSPTKSFNQKGGIQYETQASLDDMESISNNSSLVNHDSSNMLYTFFKSNTSHQQKNNYENISMHSFITSSVEKIVIYGLFLNLLHLHQQVKQNDRDFFNHSFQLAQEAIKKVKVAMVCAARPFKAKDKKNYLKIRYLYDQLMNYSSSKYNYQQEYIKIIIQQFDSVFIEETFKHLSNKSKDLANTLFLHPTRDIFSKGFNFSQNLNKSIQYLQINLILANENKNFSQMGNEKLIIVAQQMSNGLFQFKKLLHPKLQLSFSFN